MNFDVQSLTLTALVAIGTVNVVTFFKPDTDSRVRFFISVVAAFAVSFVPADLGSLILEKSKDAILAALAASGGYKLMQKAGGN